MELQNNSLSFFQKNKKAIIVGSAACLVVTGTVIALASDFGSDDGTIVKDSKTSSDSGSSSNGINGDIEVTTGNDIPNNVSADQDIVDSSDLITDTVASNTILFEGGSDDEVDYEGGESSTEFFCDIESDKTTIFVDAGCLLNSDTFTSHPISNGEVWIDGEVYSSFEVYSDFDDSTKECSGQFLYEAKCH